MFEGFKKHRVELYGQLETLQESIDSVHEAIVNENKRILALESYACTLYNAETNRILERVLCISTTKFKCDAVFERFQFTTHDGITYHYSKVDGVSLWVKGAHIKITSTLYAYFKFEGFLGDLITFNTIWTSQVDFVKRLYEHQETLCNLFLKCYGKPLDYWVLKRNYLLVMSAARGLPRDVRRYIWEKYMGV